jgi:cytochrome b
MQIEKKRVWDPLVRIFHWSLVLAFGANALFIDEDSAVHQWVGYFVVGLIIVRLAWGFVGSHYARFSSFPPSIGQSIGQLRDISAGRRTIHLGHTPLGALMIYNLMATMLVIGFSGYLMTTDALWGVEWPGEMHEIAVTWAEISVLVHILAVMIESYRTKVNLPEAMVTGYKKIPTD